MLRFVYELIKGRVVGVQLSSGREASLLTMLSATPKLFWTHEH